MRLFIAIPMPPWVKEQLVERQSIGGVKWQRPDQFHLTLKFLGDTEPEFIPPLKRNLEKIKIPEFSLSINGFGYFSRGKKPIVLWADISSTRQLEKLHQEVEEVCTELGFEAEKRSFKPHITIGRINDATRQEVESFINKHDQFYITDIPVTQFILYESQLNPDGAKHLQLKSYHLES